MKSTLYKFLTILGFKKNNPYSVDVSRNKDGSFSHHTNWKMIGYRIIAWILLIIILILVCDLLIKALALAICIIFVIVAVYIMLNIGSIMKGGNQHGKQESQSHRK